MTSIFDFPPELLDAIADWIDAPGDLRRLASAIHPSHGQLLRRHYEYRSIRCPVNATCLWSALSVDVALCRNIRSLAVVDRGSTSALHMPPAFYEPRMDCAHCIASHQHPGECGSEYRVEERMFMAALKNMGNLMSFRWNNPEGTQIEGRSDLDDENLWTAFIPCQNLTQFRVLDQASRSFSLCTMFGLSNLTVFCFNTRWLTEGQQDCSHIGVMLRERCPNLQKLTLVLYYDWWLPCTAADIGDTILSGRWPGLNDLRLCNARCSPESISAFLSAHPGIRYLDIDEYVGSQPTPGDDDHVVDEVPCPLPLLLAPGSLPYLRELACFPGQALDILAAVFSGDQVHGAVSARIHFGKDWAPEAFARLTEFLTFVNSRDMIGKVEIPSLEHLLLGVPRGKISER